MAQVGIREFDAKNMFYSFLATQNYSGIKIKSEQDFSRLDNNKKYIIKPDMLFGKRWKRWLLGINLNKTEALDWYKEKSSIEHDIDGIKWNLDTFLVENLVDIVSEYYISFSQDRDGDTIAFSTEWWIDIEDNWDKTKSITISVLSDIDNSTFKNLWVEDKSLETILTNLWKYYKNYWFVYLEINPIAITSSWDFEIIDMVAKIDDQEHYIQKDNWKNLEIPPTFWYKENLSEKTISDLDKQTWASLKFKVLNENAKIWTLFAWGGWSLILTDSLWALGYSEEIWNYWELSWDPTREFTYHYVKALLEQMFQSKWENKYLIIAWAIANFTQIDKTFAWIIDVFKEYKKELKEIKILVRRWWLNEKIWLELIESECNKMWLDITIAWSNTYMTDILKEIK